MARGYLASRFYRLYRGIKIWCLVRRPPIVGRLFFRLLEISDRLLSPRRNVDKLDQIQNVLWKAIYFHYYKTAPLYCIKTEVEIASTSDDHKWPRGTLFDNSKNPLFNRKLYYFCNYKPDFALLDLGCAGGGLVRSILEDGYNAVGVEGSDISRRLRSGEWGNCPFHLFTADITAPFELQYASEGIVRFDVVTAWEVLEHIPETKMRVTIENVVRHLKPNGYFIGSVDMTPDGNLITGATYHLTLKNKAWWLALFEEFGLYEVSNHPFVIDDFLRGNATGLRDWDPRDGDGFHLVLQLRTVNS